MGFWAILILLVGALALGVFARYIFRERPGFGHDWLLTAIGAAVGGVVASEYLGDAGEWGWEVDGMFVFSALIGAIVLGAIVELVVQLMAPKPTSTA